MNDEFNSAVEEALAEMPEEFAKRLDNVTIFVQDYPNASQARQFRLREENIMLLGLYEGIPHTKRGNYGIGGALPDKITLFRYPLMSISRNESELKAQIKATLFHEIGHHFGMSEEDIERAIENNKNAG